jgi:hypothetical protein
MKIFTALLLSVFLLSTAQAETLFISGNFKSVISAKGEKPQKDSGYDRLAIYDDGTYSSIYDDLTSGYYSKNGNTYTLSMTNFFSYLEDAWAYDDISIVSHTPYQMIIKLNKNHTKATVKTNVKLWLNSYYDEKIVKLSLKFNCKCSATQ